MDRKALVIGIGNVIRQDDGVGAFCAALIKENLNEEKKKLVDVITVHQLDVLHCEQFAGYELLIFIDADARDGEAPFVVEEAASQPDSRHFTSHIGSIPDLLALTGTLYGKTPRAYTVAVRGKVFEVGDRLSSEVCRNARKAITEVIRLIDDALPFC